MTQPPTDGPTSLTERVGGLSDAYLACRTLGHSWTPQTASWHPESRAYYAGYRCSRCTCERRAWFDHHGRPVSNRYVYPEGYTMPGVGHLDADDRGQIRLESFGRMLLSDIDITHDLDKAV